MQLSFTIPGETVPWARAGVHGKVKFTPKKQSSFMGVVKLFAQTAMRGHPPLDGPLQMVVIAVYAWPKSWSAAKRARPGARWKVSRPDTSNIVKIVEDALNTVLYGDDAQIADSRTIKVYGDVPRCEVRVRGLSSEQCNIA